jgi:pantoate--beta-alanine ligase
MKLFADVAGWSEFRAGLGQGAAGPSIGFVPTMGALHVGHVSLVESSQRDNDITVVSIFVNPTQFDQAADLERYPRTTEADLAVLRACNADAVFMPAAQSLYPDSYTFRVSETELSRKLDGAHRPGHFDGVLTVVMKLLNIIRPTRAYFGEKDFQQLQLVRGMVDAFFLPLGIVACPTVRETDGLAMSSRNTRLNPQQRAQAPGLFRALQSAGSAAQAREQLQQLGFDVDYVEDLDGRRLGAARLGEVRLIDNVAIG